MSKIREMYNTNIPIGSHPTVCTEVVANNLCIGCGVCAALCPLRRLEIGFNEFGEYIVRENNKACPDACNICLNVCPFSEKEENEDTLGKKLFSHIKGIKHSPKTGYYLDLYAGYSNVDKHRAHGASGGMATWLLETLLRNNIVDYVICVTPNNDPEKLFHFAVFDDIDSIRRSAKSAYYPVEMSIVIKEILKNKGRYAITGLPCFLKGLRLAAKRNKKLRERIIITIGLVCGQMKSKHYTAYLASLAGINGKLKKINYRGKDSQKPASNYFFHCTNEKNSEGKLFCNDGVGIAWNNRWFTPNACNFCDDVFAESADVCLMDAWLPEYSQNSRGTNLLISRTPTVSNLLLKGKNEGQITIEKIPIEKVIQAQLGLLNVKRNHFAYRLYRAKQNGLPVTTKRVAPSKRIGLLDKKLIELKDKMQNLSRVLFLKFYVDETLNLRAFSDEINPFTKELRKWERLNNILHLPVRAIRRVKRSWL